MSSSILRNVAASVIALGVAFTATAAPAMPFEAPNLPAITPKIEHVLRPSVGSNSNSCGSSCQRAVRELIKAWNAHTNPDKCYAQTFRADRTVDDCRSDQLQTRYIGYAVGGAVAVGVAALRGMSEDEGEDEDYGLGLRMS